MTRAELKKYYVTHVYMWWTEMFNHGIATIEHTIRPLSTLPGQSHHEIRWEHNGQKYTADGLSMKSVYANAIEKSLDLLESPKQRPERKLSLVKNDAILENPESEEEAFPATIETHYDR